MQNRRTFLKVLSGAAAAGTASLPIFRALATDCSPGVTNEFFICIHAAGGWDVTLWSDPRNRRTFVTDPTSGHTVQFVEPASTDNTDTALVRLWMDDNVSDSVNGDYTTFKLITPSNSSLVFGPGIGNMLNHVDRMCLINGLAMNTVSHPDGTVFSATGRHLSGGRAPASSIDTMLGNEFGTMQLLPVVSVNFPSSFVGNLDERAMPLRVGTIGTIGKSLSRTTSYDSETDRDEVTAVLTQEATDLASRSYYPQAYEGMALQFQALSRLLGTGLTTVFSAGTLEQRYPNFNYRGRLQGSNAVNAAFAVEAMKNNLVRVVSFALGNLDTHNANYKYHAENQQEIFDIIAALIDYLDAAPHPCLSGAKLSDHTHIIVVSEFCRTPQINLAMGRDHYPNNSALVISPKFRSNFSYGSTDPDQMLPVNAPNPFSDGARPIAPPDLLATFVSAFGIDPRKYLRDGEVVPALLQS